MGDHLAQIYEKLGRTKEAAHIYELALATSPTISESGFPQTGANKLNEEIRARYKKLTGKTPSTMSTRLPNGQWTMTPSEELSKARETRLGNPQKLKGSAEFSIVFAGGNVESVRYISGESQLKLMTETLKKAKYKVEVPAGSTAKLVRRVVLACYPESGCGAVLYLPQWAIFRARQTFQPGS